MAKATNKIECIALDGVRWYLWRDGVTDAELHSEIYRALMTYPKIRVNHKHVYSKEAA